MKKITKYFRNAILSSLQENIIFYKDKKFGTLTWTEIESGKVNVHDLDMLWSDTSESEINEFEKKQEKNVIIALKTISTEYSEGGQVSNNLDEMTCLLFLPAKIDKDGTLCKQDDRLPWIPREFLIPMIEPQIAIGTVKDYDCFLENSTDKRNQIDSWKKYLEYAQEMFEFVTKTKFSDKSLKEQPIRMDGKFYIFEDDTVNSVFRIMKVYDDLLKGDKNKLYSKITNGITEPSIPICNKHDREKMIYHCGQMGGEYPLSPSQREAISCFQEIKEGDVLAVNGPPGTGKTTLLQSIIANMYVKAALSKADAPIIIATSTNNQAVTNIINTLGKINPIGISNLENRWITGIHSFSVYFPANGQIKEAQKNNYQYTNVNGIAFAEDIETDDNRKKAKELFQEEFCKYFGEKDISLEKAKEYIHAELMKTEKQRIDCIESLIKVKAIIGEGTSGKYILCIKNEISDIDRAISQLMGRMEYIKQYGEKLVRRCAEWRNSYNKLPWYVRMLKFISFFKKKIAAWSYENMEYDELDFLERGMNIDEIENAYKKRIHENDVSFKKIRGEIESFQTKKKRFVEKDTYIHELLHKTQDMFGKFSAYNICINDQQFYEDFNIEKLNNLLDKVRYVEFWMAVHYYEALWLSKERAISEKQKGKTFESVLNIMYHRLAMLTPCMVMTCYMLPKQFWAYENNDKTHYFVYDFADLLIVDEAGQISPEIGAAAFAFAKKAVVVGDEQQIPPVWGTAKALDIAMAISNEVIKNKEDFVTIEANGLNCSQSSVMKIASQACQFEKFGKGLFLSEHRRCYNEIVQYCNDLVYGGKLEPLRGYAGKDKNYVLLDYLPPMGHKQIESAYSRKIGTSRQNKNEAEEIVAWIEKNYPILYEKYRSYAIEKGEDFDKKSIIGIITPFKSQSMLIKRMIKKQLPNYKESIAIGTVHTFQGTEKKVILFSSVYGNMEGCYFINMNASLMNVAVSRAKDSFLVFGDRGCLVGDKKSAAIMLKQATAHRID